MKKLFPFLLFFVSLSGVEMRQCFAQNFTQEEQYQIDNLNAIIINQNSHDTSLASAYLSLSEMLGMSNYDTVIPLCIKAKLIAEKALLFDNSTAVKTSLLKSLSGALNNIGFVYDNQGEIKKALKYYHQSLEIGEKIGDKHGVAMTLNNIGLVYYYQGDSEKAMEYHKNSLAIRKEIDDKYGIAMSLNNIGFIYDNQFKLDTALDYYLKTLNIAKEINDNYIMASTVNNIGIIYNKQALNLINENGNRDSINKKTEDALNYFKQSLKIQEEIEDKEGVTISLINIAVINFRQGNFVEAKKNAEESLQKSKALKFPKNIKEGANLLSKIYEKQGNGIKALEMYKLYIQMKDSINNEETQKASAKQEAKYEYEKQKVLDDAENDKLIAIEKEAKEKQQVITYATGAGLGLVGIFLFFVFNRLQVTRKQKKVIEEQKQKVEQQKAVVEEAHDLLEEKNQEIMDSIIYAKRIQSAILPPLKVVKEYLQESFILYKPKDVVAGDFYWLEHNEGKVLFAAADCTGHGVPGAMVSVVCNNALNRSVREHGLTDPGEILNKTREIVVQEFEKSDEEVKDGMDIALCSLSTVSSSSGAYRELKYAGANNPLWIIRDCPTEPVEVLGNPNVSVFRQAQDDTLCIIETSANKQPIGKFDNPEPYTTNSFELQKGDSIYIFSDGYVDQFGGEKGKKFKAKAFRELLLSIQDKVMEEQRIIIDEAFENWKGSLEQIDDVCVIGVKI